MGTSLGLSYNAGSSMPAQGAGNFVPQSMDGRYNSVHMILVIVYQRQPINTSRLPLDEPCFAACGAVNEATGRALGVSKTNPASLMHNDGFLRFRYWSRMYDASTGTYEHVIFGKVDVVPKPQIEDPGRAGLDSGRPGTRHIEASYRIGEIVYRLRDPVCNAMPTCLCV